YRVTLPLGRMALTRQARCRYTPTSPLYCPRWKRLESPPAKYLSRARASEHEATIPLEHIGGSKAPSFSPNAIFTRNSISAGGMNRNPRDDMKAHSIYVEQRTIYKCSCDREFDDIQKAESHLRNPPQEKGKSLR